MNDKEKGMEIDNMTEEELNSGDAEFVSSMFADDGLDVPESLSKENVAAMLAEAEQKTAEKAVKKTVRKHSWKTFGWIVAAAACLLLLVVPVMNSGEKISSDLLTFKSYDEIYSMIDEITHANDKALYGGDIYYSEDAEMEGSADSGTAKEYAAAPRGGASVLRKNSLGAADGAAGTAASGS